VHEKELERIRTKTETDGRLRGREELLKRFDNPKLKIETIRLLNKLRENTLEFDQFREGTGPQRLVQDVLNEGERTNWTLTRSAQK
jgi:hypothetical protein